MEVLSIIYLVEDSFGNEDYAVCGCSSETIQICGMKDKAGGELYFESDAYHLINWCTENDLKFKYVEKVHELNVRA